MNSPGLEAIYTIQSDLRRLDEELFTNLWTLFRHIAKKWEMPEQDIEKMKSSFSVFISNRILTDYNYLQEYLNAVSVVKAMQVQEKKTAEQAYETLLTTTEGNIFPPVTPLARARQKVSNEFIVLFISLGGFKSFSADVQEKNYPGYIGGINLHAQTPYITYPDAP